LPHHTTTDSPFAASSSHHKHKTLFIFSRKRSAQEIFALNYARVLMLPLIMFSFILLQQIILVSGRSSTNLLSQATQPVHCTFCNRDIIFLLFISLGCLCAYLTLSMHDLNMKVTVSSNSCEYIQSLFCIIQYVGSYRVSCAGRCDVCIAIQAQP